MNKDLRQEIKTKKCQLCNGTGGEGGGGGRPIYECASCGHCHLVGTSCPNQVKPIKKKMERLPIHRGVKLSSTLSGQRELIREYRNKINELIDAYNLAK